MENKPIKRHKSLQPLSRQHHLGLLFSWKIRKGFSKNIEISRMADFSNWFYDKEIKPHFLAEEKYVFTVLNDDNELIVRALNDHKEIEKLFHEHTNLAETLTLLSEKLELHIRFEERVLFNEIQKVATAEQLLKIEEIHINIESPDEYPDPFWN